MIDNYKNMLKEQTLDNPKSTSTPSLFEILAIGFLFGSSLSFLDGMIYQVFKDLFIAIDLKPLTALWLANIATTILHLVLVISTFFAVQKKLNSNSLDWKRMYSQSKYVFAISILIFLFFQLYWDSVLPESFFFALGSFNFQASESSTFVLLPIIFSVIDILLIVILLKRLANKMTKVDHGVNKA